MLHEEIDTALDWDVPELYEIPPYDEDAIYNSKPEELMAEEPVTDLFLTKPVAIDLDSATRAQVTKGGERGQHVLGRDSTNYSIKAERLVWVDGWRDGAAGSAMTLAVFKISFFAKTPAAKVGFASAELRFKAENEDDKDPEVVAWGPFRYPETWNAWKAQRRVNVKDEQRLEVGYAGQKGVLGRTAEDETSWESVDFDSGRSTTLSNLNKVGAAPNGVMWTVTQNQIHRQSVTPEIRVGVLISRPSSTDRYLVDFRLTAITGDFSALKEKLKGRLFGRSGDSNSWIVTPRQGDKTNCHAEGKVIVKSVDPDNLSKLVSEADVTNLSPDWLNAWQRFEVPQPGTGPGRTADDAAATEREAAAAATAAAATAAATATATAAAATAAAAAVAAAATIMSGAPTQQPVQRRVAAAGDLSDTRETEPTAGAGLMPAQLGEEERENDTARPSAKDAGAVAAVRQLQPPDLGAVSPKPHLSHPPEAPGLLGDTSPGGAAGAPCVGLETAGRTLDPPGPQRQPLWNAHEADHSYPDLYGRLLSLEARAAQAESRIAVQDQLILQLQQALAGTEMGLPGRGRG